VLRIDRYTLPAVDLNQPGELHERTARGIQDHPLDVSGGSLDPKHTSANDC
jgi:hypothetical protein